MQTDIGKMLIYGGLIMVAIGLFLHFGGKFLPLGRLPGDINYQSGNTSFHFPIVTCILISVVLNIILRLFK